MSKRISHVGLLLLCIATIGYAQAPTVILPTDLLVNSRETINANFETLYNQVLSENVTKATLVDCSGTPGSVVRKLNGSAPSECGTIDGAVSTLKSLNNVRYASQFSGSDCGAKINAAYLDLPSAGGNIVQDVSCSFTTPIVFGSSGKAAMLLGYPGGAVTLTYTSVSGVAITLNYGTGLTMGKGIRDLTLSGPGNSTGTIGVLMGGSSGAQGTLIDNLKIQSFGTNFQLGSNTWIADIRHSMIRDGGINVLFPSGLTQAGENIRFDHVTFADSPAPHINSVWIQGGGQEIIFESCSFDQAQLRIGNTSVSAAQVVVHEGHFENPNYATGGTDYEFLVLDNNNGNYLRLTDSFFEQDRSSGGAYGRLLALSGGSAFISGTGMYSPVQLTNFATLSNAVVVSLFGFNDLSGNTVALFGGTTTGYITSFPGANPAQSTGFNSILGAGDVSGGAATSFRQDVAVGTGGVNRILTVNGALTVNTGNVNISGGGLQIGGVTRIDNSSNFSMNDQYMTGGCTGCAIAGVFNQFFQASSTPTWTATKNAAISLGTNQLVANTRTILLPVTYINVNAYQCTATSRGSSNAIWATHNSTNQVTFTGNGVGTGDTFDYICIGN